MRISWETVAALAVVVVGCSLVTVFTPPATWEMISTFETETWVGIGLVASGVVAALFGRPIARPDDAEPKIPTSIRKKEDGSIAVQVLEVLVMVAAAVAFGLFVGTLGGCGSSLAAHATAARVMGVALDGAYEVAEAHAVAATEACVTAGDEACVRDVHASMVPVAIALSGLELSWSGYVSTIEIGHLAGASAELLDAMRRAAARMLEAYAQLSDALTRAGVALPSVPPMVLALVGEP